MAFACKLSFDRSHGSFVFFENKTKLLARIQKALGAPRLFRCVRALNLKAAEQRINPHFLQQQHLTAMIKEPKNVDFYTTGRQLSEQEFARISEWIKQHKEKQAARKSKSITGTKPPIS